jgi:hypothetical protein
MSSLDNGFGVQQFLLCCAFYKQADIKYSGFVSHALILLPCFKKIFLYIKYKFFGDD